MRDFIALDFETANPKRVSACSLGLVHVQDGKVIDSQYHLIKPVGGHQSRQTMIHGIREEDTRNSPDFGQLFSSIANYFEQPVVAYSLFDKQVLNALSIHYGLPLQPNYTDATLMAKERLPHLDNHRLKTLARHFSIPQNNHHNALEDALVCAKVYLALMDLDSSDPPMQKIDHEFIGLLKGILFDQDVNYREAYALLYWLDDNPSIADKHRWLYDVLHQALQDNKLDEQEKAQIKNHLEQLVRDFEHV
jgi:DNA polymerase-3 subunit epsilon